MIRTYPFSDPDPVPILCRDPRIYPYFAFDGFTDRPREQEWTVVQLENEYLSAAVLPQVGGKVYGALEKSTGREFIYTNDALKFRRIALRGPWTSGGIEFNFGVIGHTPSTATPVEYLTRHNADGSATCFVGSLDLPSRTRWTVAITMPRSGAYLETRTFWFNPTPFDQSYYSWSTAAVSVRPDLRYDYPGTSMVQHSASTDNARWPLSPGGRDLSWYRQNDFEGSKSYFVFGEYASHFGAVQADSGFGLGHWATYDDMPGRKVWIWSLARDGGIWENLLTDAKGQYSEPQAGRLLSQVDHEFFPPYTGDSWRELWFPVTGIGRLTAASPWAALGLERSGDTVRVALCALQGIDDELVVREGDRVLLRHRLTLKALEHQVFLLKGSVGSLRVTLGDGKFSYDEDPESRVLTRPVRYAVPADSTAEGLFLSGEYFEKERRRGEALERYLACLRAEPRHVSALTRTALLLGERGEAERGLSYATRALELDKYLPAANYAYGVLSRLLGHLADAKETFGWAARSLEFRSNAYCQIAELSLAENDWSASLEYALKSIQFNALNSNARTVQAIALRKMGRPAEAMGILRELLQFDPFNHQARFEQHLSAPAEMSAERFAAGIRTEITHESHLEAAAAYLRVGLRDEALQLLALAPEQPMVDLWRGFISAQGNPAAGRGFLERALKGSIDFVFPFREEEVRILQWAMRESPSSWKPRYYLALVLWGKGRKREALEMMNGCSNVDASTFFLARALLRKELGGEGVFPDLERAVSMDSTSWRAWHQLIAHCAATGLSGQGLGYARRAVRLHPDQIVLQMDFASALYDEGDYKRSLEVLSGLNVLPYEGSWEAHDLFVRASLRLGLRALNEGRFKDCLRSVESSRDFPEHLGTGEPWEPDSRMQDYLAYRALKEEGKRDDAAKLLDRITGYTRKLKLGWGTEHFVGLIALEETGNPGEADALAREWQSLSPQDPLLRCWLARRRHDDVGRLLRDARRDPRCALRLEIVAW
jgi:tetratricopeptide (TPR) repeat protein